MVGALSIVRFRTPVKNPSELIMYFILITLGIVTNVDPSKTVTFLLLISLASIGLEIYKYITKKLNLAIYNFNEKDIYLSLVLSKDYPDLVSKKSLFIYRKMRINSVLDLNLITKVGCWKLKNL